MTYAQLLHAIRASCNVADETELYVFGSQSILASSPNLPSGLTASIEVDVQPKTYPDRVDLIDGALGEMSPFHKTHGFYVHGVPIEVATLPSGWQSRCLAVSDSVLTNGNTGWCLEAYDLAASKVAAFRPKDREFVSLMLASGIIRVDVLRARIRMQDLSDETKEGLIDWVERTASLL